MAGSGHLLRKNRTLNPECAIVLGDSVFILLDTFSGDLDPDHDHDGVYVAQDAEKLAALIEKYRDEDIYLASHWFDADRETDAFCDLVANTDAVKGMFVGHTHHCSVIERPDRFGAKKIAQTGNFSYTSEKDTVSTFWGFRDLVIKEGKAVSAYTVVESDAVLNGERVHIPYRKHNCCEF